jgi:AcrR family transcriptional regulator
MRTKSDERRQAILDVAMEVFKDIGYERATMAAISARVGGSKATLYSYFASKEELFATAMVDAVCEQGEAVCELLHTQDRDIATVLKRFGAAFIPLITSQDAMAVVRSAVAEGGHGTLGPALYAMGPQRGDDELAAYLGALPQDCGLSLPNPRRAARHLRALLEASFVQSRLYGMPMRHDVQEEVDAAVDVFLRAYAA